MALPGLMWVMLQLLQIEGTCFWFLVHEDILPRLFRQLWPILFAMSSHMSTHEGWTGIISLSVGLRIGSAACCLPLAPHGAMMMVSAIVLSRVCSKQSGAVPGSG